MFPRFMSQRLRTGLTILAVVFGLLCLSFAGSWRYLKARHGNSVEWLPISRWGFGTEPFILNAMMPPGKPSQEIVVGRIERHGYYQIVIWKPGNEEERR